MASKLWPRLQSAPVRFGDIGIAGVGSWTGTSDPVGVGTYLGDLTRTFTFTVDTSGTSTIGTTASITLSIVDGQGWTGTIEIGTDVSYTADSAVPVTDGFAVEFGGGTVKNAETFTIAVVARNRIRGDHAEIIGNVNPVAMEVAKSAWKDHDTLFETDSEEVFRNERSIRRIPALKLDYLGDADRRRFIQMLHGRHRVSFAEGYDYSTLLAFTGGGLLPRVGRKLTFARVGVGAYRDPDSGLWKITATGEPRFSGGPELESQVPSNNYRHQQPPQESHMGSAIVLGAASTNLVPTFHPEKDDQGVVALHWEVAGSGPTIAFTDEIEGILDPDGGWKRKFTRGVMRVENNGATGVNHVRTLAADRWAVTAGLAYTGQVWVRGRGEVLVSMFTGVAVPDTAYGSTSLGSLNPDRWVRFTVGGAVNVAAGHTIAEFRLSQAAALGSDLEVMFVAAAQCELGGSWSELIQTDGNAQTRNAETLTSTERVPPNGSISAWLRWPNDQHNAIRGLFQDSTKRFILERDGRSGFEDFNWYTDDTGRANATQSGDLINWKYDTWNHIGMTWEQELRLDPFSFKTMAKIFYLNGVEAFSVQTLNRATEAYGTLEFAPNDAGPEADWSDNMGLRIHAFRMDSRVLSAQEMAEQYDRVGRDEWAHLHREYTGRSFWMGKGSEIRRAINHPDQHVANVQLVQASVEPDSLVTRL